MNESTEYRIALAEGLEPQKLPRRPGRRGPKNPRAKALVSAASAVRLLKATTGAEAVLAAAPSLARASLYVPTASFTVCAKTGTATFLDIWDADHFDFVSDIRRNLAECRVWFSAEGYAVWDAPQTKTGRINCYFQAPTSGNYSCTVVLRSYGGPAMVECLIDAFNFGPLPFNGLKIQPHPANLAAGYHSFRIRQLTGAFFFESLTVWRV